MDADAGRRRGEPLWLAALLAWTVGVALGRRFGAGEPDGDPANVERAASALDGSPRELRRLPGIGETRAIAIARERWARRGDASFEIGDVRGIGPKTVERIDAFLARTAGGE